MNILPVTQAARDSLSSSSNDISCCSEIAPLNHPAETTQTAQSRVGAAHLIFAQILKEKPWQQHVCESCIAIYTANK